MSNYGLEEYQDFWCVFKTTEKGQTYWLNKDRKWTSLVGQRAGIRSYEKALEVMAAEIKKGEKENV